MPIIVYQVGHVVFGAYAGVGYVDFYGTLSGKVRSGDAVAWFLILAPYIGWQCVRLMLLGWRMTGQKAESS